jgi:hypothetical protein
MRYRCLCAIWENAVTMHPEILAALVDTLDISTVAG